MIKKNLTILVAYSKNKVIGAQGTIPWKLPSERNRFKEICQGKKIIMGRKSFEEIGHGLPYCTIIIVSRTMKKCPEGCLLAESFEEAVKLAESDGDLDTEDVIDTGAGSCTRASNLDTGSDVTTGATIFPNASPPQNTSEILIAGGQEVYKQAIPYTQTIYATEIQKNYPGDRFFPELALDQWKITDEESHRENGVEFRYLTIKRI